VSESVGIVSSTSGEEWLSTGASGKRESTAHASVGSTPGISYRDMGPRDDGHGGGLF